MVDGGWFDELEAMARKIRRSKLPFGGIQLICCGDFLQLPPVSKGDEIKSYAFQARTWKTCMVNCACCSDDLALATAILPQLHRRTSPPPMYTRCGATALRVRQSDRVGFLVVSRRCPLKGIELQQVRRQSDPTFIEMLRRVRLGECTPDDVDLVRLARSARSSGAPQSIEPDYWRSAGISYSRAHHAVHGCLPSFRPPPLHLPGSSAPPNPTTWIRTGSRQPDCAPTSPTPQRSTNGGSSGCRVRSQLAGLATMSGTTQRCYGC